MECINFPHYNAINKCGVIHVNYSKLFMSDTRLSVLLALLISVYYVQRGMWNNYPITKPV